MKIHLSALSTRHAQLPLIAVAIVLLAAGAFAWQGNLGSKDTPVGENTVVGGNTAEIEKIEKVTSAGNFVATKMDEQRAQTETANFAAQDLNASAQDKELSNFNANSETAIAILVDTNSEAEGEFLPAVIGPDVKPSVLYESNLARLVGNAETDERALIKRLVNEGVSVPEAVPQIVETIEAVELPDWRRFAALSKEAGTAPIIAIVIDDLGHSERDFSRVMSLGEGITLAFLPYTERVAEFAKRARQKGFEILVHMPMEPTDATVDPGPNALLTGLSDSELMRRLTENLARLEGYVGINNHMGSKFSQDKRAMGLVLDALDARGLLYLDSVTIGSTVGERVATASRMPFAARDVFLDTVADEKFIERQLRILEKVARETGHAVAIGHPYAETMAVLQRWLPEARKRGFEFVPISTVAALECAC